MPLKNIFLWFDFLYNVISCGDTDLEWEDHRREVMDLSLTVQVTAVHLRLELSVPGLHRTESLQGTAEAWLHVRHYRLQLEPIKNNFNSLASGRCGRNFKSIIFKLIIHSSSLGTRCEIAVRWTPQELPSEKSTLVQVLAWCHQAPSHYLSQCWPKFMSPYPITGPQWVSGWLSLTAFLRTSGSI